MPTTNPYDAACTKLRDETGARIAMVIVCMDRDGQTGFSVQHEEGQATYMLPALLRDIADRIERGR